MALSEIALKRAEILSEQNLNVSQLLEITNELATEQYNDNFTKMLETASILYAMKHRNKSKYCQSICRRWAELENAEGA